MLGSMLKQRFNLRPIGNISRHPKTTISPEMIWNQETLSPLASALLCASALSFSYLEDKIPLLFRSTQQEAWLPLQGQPRREIVNLLLSPSTNSKYPGYRFDWAWVSACPGHMYEGWNSWEYIIQNSRCSSSLPTHPLPLEIKVGS